MPESAYLIWVGYSADMSISQQPIARLCASLKFHSELMAHCAVSTVAADEPGAFDSFLVTVGVAKSRSHTSRRFRKCCEFDSPLDLHPELVQKFLEQALGFALRNHEREGIMSVGILETDASDRFGASRDVGGSRL